MWSRVSSSSYHEGGVPTTGCTRRSALGHHRSHAEVGVSSQLHPQCSVQAHSLWIWLLKWPWDCGRMTQVIFPSSVDSWNLRLLLSLGCLRSKFFPFKWEVILFSVYTLGSLLQELHCWGLPVQNLAVPSLFPKWFPAAFIPCLLRNSIFRLALQKSSISLWHFHSPKHCCSRKSLGCDIFCCVTLGKGTTGGGGVGQGPTDDSCSYMGTSKQRIIQKGKLLVRLPLFSSHSRGKEVLPFLKFIDSHVR